MTVTTIGSGVASADVPEVPEEPTIFGKPSVPEGFDIMGLVDAIKQGMRQEMDAAVADIERRLAQAREIERSVNTGFPRETVHTEDLNIGMHMLDGYTLTANSPGAGSIAWGSLHIVLLGVDYTITDANTNLKYAWFVKPGSYTPGTPIPLSTSNTMPTLAAGDALVFINNGGTPISVLESSVVYAVGPGVIGAAQLDSATSTLLSNLQATDVAQQAAIDGTISSFYQANPPWPDGSPSPSGGNINQGDIWYDSDNGWTYRWTGSGGSPANTWFRIADTDIALVQSKLNTRTTTYLAVLASPPAAPSGGFTTGDFWMVTDQGNLIKRWSGSAWVDLQMGDAAISAVGGAKIGTGINAANVSTGTMSGTRVGAGINAANVDNGTLAAARVGAGVAGAVLDSATGTVAGSQVGTGINGTNVTTGTVPAARVGAGVTGAALNTGTGVVPIGGIPTLTPAKLNTAFHMLY